MNKILCFILALVALYILSPIIVIVFWGALWLLALVVLYHIFMLIPISHPPVEEGNGEDLNDS